MPRSLIQGTQALSGEADMARAAGITSVNVRVLNRGCR